MAKQPTWERKYLTLEDFLAVIDGKEEELRKIKSEANNSGSSFSGTENIGEAINLARFGWKEGADRVRDIADELAVNLESHIIKQASFHDVEGADINIGRYLEGEPDCMVNYKKAERTGSPIISISVNCSISACTGKERIEARGAAISALIDLLETSGARVELWAGSLTEGKGSGYTYAQRVCIKQADDMLDIDRVAFCISHPSFLRRLSFAEKDLCSSVAQCIKMGYRGNSGGYGHAVELVDPNMDLHIKSDNNEPRPWEDKHNASAWIIEQLKFFKCYQD